jgi:hypothetical protein
MIQRGRIGGLFVCAVITVVMVLRSYKNPHNNWDEVCYVGSALSWSLKPPAEAQKATYQALREATSARAFTDDTTGPYRNAVYRDANSFALQLPFYQLKPAYVGLIWLSWKMGFNPVRATSVISAVTAGCLGLMVAAILTRSLGGFAGAMVYPVVLVLAGIWASGRFSTPDALSALVVFSGGWMLRLSRTLTSNLGLLLLCLAVGVRPDNLLLLLSCGAGLIFAGIAGLPPTLEVQIRRIALLMVLGVALWITIGRFAGDYGWKILMHHSFARLIRNNSDLSAFRWADYREALSGGLGWLAGTSSPGNPRMAFSPQFPLLLVLTCVFICFGEPGRDALLLTAIVLYMIAHFFLFPSGQERFFCGVNTFIFVLGAEYIYTHRKNRFGQTALTT